MTYKWKENNELFGSFGMFVVPILLGIIFYSRMPEQMVVHFGANNVADGFAPKIFALFGIPILLIMLHLIVAMDGKGNPKRLSAPRGVQLVINWIVPVLSTGLQITIISYSVEKRLNLFSIAIIAAGILLIILGDYLPVILLNRDMQNKVRKAAGAAVSILGLLCILATVFICVT